MIKTLAYVEYSNDTDEAPDPFGADSLLTTSFCNLSISQFLFYLIWLILILHCALFKNQNEALQNPVK